MTYIASRIDGLDPAIEPTMSVELVRGFSVRCWFRRGRVASV